MMVSAHQPCGRIVGRHHVAHWAATVVWRTVTKASATDESSRRRSSISTRRRLDGHPVGRCHPAREPGVARDRHARRGQRRIRSRPRHLSGPADVTGRDSGSADVAARVEVDSRSATETLALSPESAVAIDAVRPRRSPSCQHGFDPVDATQSADHRLRRHVPRFHRIRRIRARRQRDRPDRPAGVVHPERVLDRNGRRRHGRRRDRPSPSMATRSPSRSSQIRADSPMPATPAPGPLSIVAYHPAYRRIADSLGLLDLYLVEPTNARIVYSVEQGSGRRNESGHRAVRRLGPGQHGQPGDRRSGRRHRRERPQPVHRRAGRRRRRDGESDHGRDDTGRRRGDDVRRRQIHRDPDCRRHHDRRGHAVRVRLQYAGRRVPDRTPMARCAAILWRT